MALLAGACNGDDTTDPADPDPPAPAPEQEEDGEESAPLRTVELPEVEGPITEGAMHLDPLEETSPEGDRAEDRGYTFDDYIAAGESAGEPYRVRVQIARPDDATALSGHAIVEAIHPQGIAFVWSFTRDLLMDDGHVAVNVSVFPNTVETLQEAEATRYGDLRVASDDDGDIAFEHASGIYAQVGAWLKSEESPLPELEWLHLTGHSRSVGPVWQYMDTHHAELRLDGGDPVYDGFFPETTRTASRMGPFPEVDVPTVLINSELEVEEVLVAEGIDYRRPDSDEAGQQFRLYEVAGMPHNLSWRHPLLLDAIGVAEAAEERCANPLNDFPYNETVSMALDHLLRWVEHDEPPPRAERVEVRGEPGVDAEVVRDEHGNAEGGVRSTTLDVPVATHLGLNEALNEEEDISPGSCLVYGSQLDFSPEQLEALYGDHGTYVEQVSERADELVDEGWVLERFADRLVDRAEAFDGFVGT